MSIQPRWPTVTCVVAAIGLASCSGSGATNPTTPDSTKFTAIAIADLAGTYATVQYEGHALPYAIPGTKTPPDTLFAGCLFLGPVSNPQSPPQNQDGYVNVTYLWSRSGADAYMANPMVCPPYMQAVSQFYQWSGSSGQWRFCGLHACSYTNFTAAVVNGKLVISTGDPGSQTVYVRQ